MKADTKSHWGWRGWAISALIPAAFFAFDAISIATYPAVRAPNVTPAEQISLLGCFYALWIVVPPIIWRLVPEDPPSLAVPHWRRSIVILFVVAMALAAAHLMILTGILRFMYAPPGGQLGDFLYSYGETMLGRAPIWLLAYVVAAGLITVIKTRASHAGSSSSRIAVRDRGRTRILDIDSIVWIQASGNYVEYHTDSKTLMARQSLRSVRSRFEAAGFIASHRSALVNLRFVESIRAGGEGESHRIVLANGLEAPLSRRNLSSFKRAIADT